MEISPQIKTEIIQALRQGGNLGQTITQIEKKVSVERHTLAKYLYLLNRDHLLSYRSIGKTTLWYLNTSPLADVLMSNDNANIIDKVFTEMVDTVEELVILLDDKKKIQYVSNQATSRFGEIIGNDISTLFGNTDIEEGPIEDRFGNVYRLKILETNTPTSKPGKLLLLYDETEKMLFKNVLQDFAEATVIIHEETVVYANKKAREFFKKDIEGLPRKEVIKEIRKEAFILPDNTEIVATVHSLNDSYALVF